MIEPDTQQRKTRNLRPKKQEGRGSFTVQEFSDRHGFSHMTTYAEIKAGRLRTFKIGRCRRISVEAEREWIAEREQESAA